jgi:universal stress protein G
MRELSASLGADRVWMEIREGDPAEQIDAVATEYSADAVVVGPHGARAGFRDRPGGTAEKLVRESKHAVLLAARPADHAPQRLLIPVDESPVTEAVLAWARLLGERAGMEMTLLHIVSSTLLNELLSAGAVASGVMIPIPDQVLTNAELDAGAWLQQLAAEAGLERPEVSTEVKAGDPTDEILAAAERLDADLVVLGSSAHGIRAALLGSVAREVLRSAKRPVLVVKKVLDEAGSAQRQAAEGGR